MTKYERKITKIGNSYGITLPKALLKETGINYGDSVEIKKEDGKISLQKKKDATLPNGLSPDFFEVLEKNIETHEKTIQDLVDR